MPFLTLKTNCKVEKKLSEELATKTAEVLGKAIKVVAVSVEYNENMAFDGSNNRKGAWFELGAIGFKDRQAVVDVLTNMAIEKLGAEKDLICINLVDLAAINVAHGGKLLGKQELVYC